MLAKQIAGDLLPGFMFDRVEGESADGQIGGAQASSPCLIRDTATTWAGCEARFAGSSRSKTPQLLNRFVRAGRYRTVNHGSGQRPVINGYSQPEIAASIETFIRREFRIVGAKSSRFRDAHLFEGGYVDSAGVVELIMFVESTFDVKLEDDHIFSEHFTTINGIAGLVAGCAAHNDRANPGRPSTAVR